MQDSPFHRFKPAAPAGVHLLLASLLWTAVGAALLSFGVKWVFEGDRTLVKWLLLPMGALGLAKAHFILTRSAARMSSRIRERGDGKCIGGFLSWKTWLLVLFMMAGGRLLRSEFVPIPKPWVGLIYAGVGLSLITASIHLWRALKAHCAKGP